MFSLKATVAFIARNLGLTSPQLYGFLGGGGTNAGERVTPQSALQLDAVWACVRLVAQTIATLPLHLYKIDADGNGSIARNHPLYVLLHDQPNFEMTAVSFWEAVVSSVLLWGNAYIRIDRNGVGTISALTPMQPDHVSVRREADGTLTFTYVNGNDRWTLTENDVMHVKGFSLDGVTGISPIAQARETIGIAQAAEKSAASFFRNGMRGTHYLASPNYLDKDRRERYENELLPKFTGSINAGRVPFLEGGWELKTLSLAPGDAELLATRQYSVEQICRWYGVPPAMVGHTEKTSSWGTGLEQMNLGFLAYGLRPHLKAIEQEIRRSLLTPVERARFYAEFNADALLRADTAGRAAMMKVLAENGLRTRNELRSLDNFAPKPGGDDLTVQANLLPVQLLGQVAQLPKEKPLDPGFTGTPTTTVPSPTGG